MAIFLARARGFLMPTLDFEREVYQHYCDGGSQLRMWRLTWLHRTFTFSYSSPWRKR